MALYNKVTDLSLTLPSSQELLVAYNEQEADKFSDIVSLILTLLWTVFESCAVMQTAGQGLRLHLPDRCLADWLAPAHQEGHQR